MGTRTYVPQLRFVLRQVDKYTKRWQDKLHETLTSGQYNCLVAVITAVTECLISLGDGGINP
jgi:hypothetical protein